MKVEPRHVINDETRELEIRGLVLISETEQESLWLDELFGSHVKPSGLIATGIAECRLSDGYKEQHVYISGVE